MQSEGAFSTELTNLETLSQAQQQPSTGVTADKEQQQIAMANAAMPLVGGLKALATDAGDNTLAALAGFTRSDFIHEPDTETANNADIIHSLATANAAGLIDCGVTQPQIDLLHTAITAFRALLAAPRQAIVGSATATAQIAASIATIDALLTKLDNLTEVLRRANPTFYTGYQSARNIIDLGGSPPPDPQPEPLQA